MAENPSYEELEQRIQALERENRELKQANSELKEYKRNFKSLFNSTQDAIMVINAANGEILDVNPSVGEILGYKKEELVGEHFTILFPPVLQSSDQFLPEEPEFFGGAFKQEFFRPDGMVCLLDLSASMTSWQEKTVILATFHEVPEW